MFEFLYIVVLTVIFFFSSFDNFWFVGLLSYFLLELLRMGLILFTKKRVFNPWFNFFMSFILILLMSVFFILIFGISLYIIEHISFLTTAIRGIVIVLVFCLINFMSVLKVYCVAKKMEYDKKTIFKHFIFSIIYTIAVVLTTYLIIYFWYY